VHSSITSGKDAGRHTAEDDKVQSGGGPENEAGIPRNSVLISATSC